MRLATSLLRPACRQPRQDLLEQVIDRQRAGGHEPFQNSFPLPEEAHIGGPSHKGRRLVLAGGRRSTRGPVLQTARWRGGQPMQFV
ncbi:hypothetical protein [Nesterenkonia flava]|uniref:hypothetical protein n=1 Tax=Nesterenkonia flava TaxID=469799 RepID=UPI0031CE9476